MNTNLYHSEVPATSAEIASYTHGVGPVLAGRLLEKFVAYKIVPPCINFNIRMDGGWINTFQHSIWKSNDDEAAVQWLMGELDKFVNTGALCCLLNGPTSHIVSPNTGEGWLSLSEERRALLFSVLPRWLRQHEGFWLGAYLRPKSGNWHSLPRPWNPNELGQLDNWKQEVDDLIKLGFRWIGIDASSSYSWLNDLALIEKNRGIELSQEGPGSFDEPHLHVSRYCVVRLVYNRTVHQGLPLPQVLDGERWYVAMTEHGVAGGTITAWDAMGITRMELAQQLRDKGWSILSQHTEDLI